jgi:hypothetical protein
MKFKPIEKPTLAGCANCSPIPTITLDKTEKYAIDFYGGLTAMTVYFGDNEFGHSFFKPCKDDEINEISLEEIEQQFKHIISVADAIVIEFESALHGEKYELNKEDGNWYLVEQTQGWA